MKRSRKKPVVLSLPAELRAVRSAAAHQVISVMERVKRATVAELAVHVGLPAGSLYYHVRRLEAVGVLLEGEKRSTGGRHEVVYELAGSEVVLDTSRSDKSFVAELARTFRSRLRALERAYVAAVERRAAARGVRGRGRPQGPSLHQHQARLGPRQRAELERRVEELAAFLVEHDDPRRRDFTHLTVAVVPLERDQKSPSGTS